MKIIHRCVDSGIIEDQYYEGAISHHSQHAHGKKHHEENLQHHRVCSEDQQDELSHCVISLLHCSRNSDLRGEKV
jgi:hypothetical protein